jgi:hypothetical protein
MSEEWVLGWWRLVGWPVNIESFNRKQHMIYWPRVYQDITYQQRIYQYILS